MRRTILFIIGSIIFFATPGFAQPSKPQKGIMAKFLDGSSAKVNDLVFVYEWVYKSDTKYSNPPIHRRTSHDFHYSTVVAGTTVDSVFAQEDINRIQIEWKKTEWIKADDINFSPISFVVTTKAKKVSIQKLSASSDFLQEKSIDQIEDTSIIWDIYIEGTAQVNGHKGHFSVKLPREYSPNISMPINKNEALIEIIFYEDLVNK